MPRPRRLLPLVLFPLLAVFLTGPAAAAGWHHPLYGDGGGWWPRRVPVEVRNPLDRPLEGEPVELTVGDGTGQIHWVGVPAESVRVCDAAGVEMLLALFGVDGQLVGAGPLPAGAVLVLPVECPSQATVTYYVYAGNPSAWAAPDVLEVRGGLVNGDVEQGEGDAPAGWRHDAPDATHRATWSDETPRSGRRCLKTEVTPGAEPTWIATRQTGIHLQGGAHYRLEAWVKAHEVVGLAGWYLHVGNQENPMMMAPTLNGGDGSFDWKPVSLEFTVPPEANRADLGTVLRGTGTAWFDQVTLECLAPGGVAVEVRPEETLTLRALGAAGDWPTGAETTAAAEEHRAVVQVLNLSDASRGPVFVSVPLHRLIARTRGRLERDGLRVTLDNQPVAYRCQGDQLLLEATLPPRSASRYLVYFAEGSPPEPAGQDAASGLVQSASNLVQNAGFEQDGPLPLDWTASGPAQGPDGVTFGLDTPGREGAGSRAARMHVPADAAPGWRGWRQSVVVRPGRTYLLSGWMKCAAADGDVRIHAHRRTAAGGLSAEQPYASIGPGISGSTNWTFLSGQLTMPADTTTLDLHLTSDQSGTVWHDEILLAEVTPGQIVAIEGRPSAADDQLQVWQVPAVVKVFPDDIAPQIPPSPAAIGSARNEQESLQLAVRSGRDWQHVRVEVDPPVGPEGFVLEEVAVRTVGYVPIDYPTNYYHSESPAWRRKVPQGQSACDGWAGLWPDPLLPWDHFDLAANATQPVWLTVRTPRQAPAGQYRGQIRLTCAGQILARVPWTVEVWDFDLPEARHLAAIYDIRLGQGDALWQGSLAEMYPRIANTMADARLSGDTVRPEPIFRRQEGRITADFAAFDAAAEVYFNQWKFPFSYTPWSFYLFGWGHPPKPLFGERPYPGEPPYENVDRAQLRPEYKAVYQEMLRLFWDHLKAKGWERRFVLYISDEPFDQHAHIRVQMRALCDMIHAVDPQIPIYSSTWKHVPEWDGYLDIWGIGHDGRVPVEKMAQLRAAGDRIWFTTDGQMCTDTPYCAVERLLPHYCFQYGAEAYEFWGVAWLTGDPYQFGFHRFIHQSSEPGESYWVRYPNGDGFLLYPGARFGQAPPVSSVRFEQAREGAEDYEYLYRLAALVAQSKEAGRDASAGQAALDAAATLVEIPNAGGRYSSRILLEPEAIYRVRRQVAAAIEGLQGR